MVKALFIWQPHAELKAHLCDHMDRVEGLAYVFPGEDEKKITEAEPCPDAQILVGWRPELELLESLPELKLVLNPGAGVQHHFPERAALFQARGIELCNGHGNAGFTAEHGFGMLLTLSRRMLEHDRWMREGRWRTGDKEAPARSLRGMKVGLAGYGHIGRKMATLLQAFGAEPLVMNRTGLCEDGFEAFPSSESGAFAAKADSVIVSLPLTPQTKGMIGRDFLEQLGEDGLLVNIGRGEVVEEKALYRALVEGVISGAALDTWYEYSPEPDEQGRKYPYMQPFHELDNVLLSPHRAASPFGDLERWEDILDNLRRFVEGEPLRNRVDLNEGY